MFHRVTRVLRRVNNQFTRAFHSDTAVARRVCHNPFSCFLRSHNAVDAGHRFVFFFRNRLVQTLFDFLRGVDVLGNAAVLNHGRRRGRRRGRGVGVETGVVNESKALARGGRPGRRDG